MQAINAVAEKLPDMEGGILAFGSQRALREVRSAEGRQLLSPKS